METYNKVLITISLAAIAAIVGIESVLGAYLGQHLFEVLGVLFGDDKIDSELEIKLAVALVVFIAFTLFFLIAAGTMAKGMRGVKHDEAEEKLQVSKWRNAVIKCLNDIAEAINNCNEQETNNSASKVNGQSDDKSNHKDLVINVVCKEKEPDSSVKVSTESDAERVVSDNGANCDSRNHQNNSESN